MSFLPSYEKREKEPEIFLDDCRKFYKTLVEVALWIMDELNYNTMTYGKREVSSCIYGASIRNGLRFDKFHPVLKKVLGLKEDGDDVDKILNDREGSFHKIRKAHEEIREEAKKLGVEVDKS